MPKRTGSRRSAVQREMQQGKTFRSVYQEAAVALLRTASMITRAYARIVEPSGLSFAQYNALRIIRGAGNAGIPTLAIRTRMIDEGTTITRLIDKLEAAGLVQRERDYPDRRQVVCQATEAGRRLLDEYDPLVNAFDEEVVGFLPKARAETFVGVLDEVRRRHGARGVARALSATP